MVGMVVTAAKVVGASANGDSHANGADSPEPAGGQASSSSPPAMQLPTPAPAGARPVAARAYGRPAELSLARDLSTSFVSRTRDSAAAATSSGPGDTTLVTSALSHHELVYARAVVTYNSSVAAGGVRSTSLRRKMGNDPTSYDLLRFVVVFPDFLSFLPPPL